MTHKLLVLAGLAMACAAPAQTTWSVGGPNGYPEIRDALELAAPGDIVLVEPGTYAQFTCNVGVTIRAITPGTVMVAYNISFRPPNCGCTCLANEGRTKLAPPLGQTVQIVGLQFLGNSVLTPCFNYIRHRVEVSSGRATFDQCTLEGGGYGLDVLNATVHLQDTTVAPSFNGPGIIATNADLTIAGGSVAGTDAPNGIYTPSNGITMVDSQLHASHTTIAGGDPISATIGSVGVHATGGSVWLSDSTVTGWMDCAIVATGVLRIDRSTLTSGGATCATSPTGAPLVGIERQSPIAIGTLFQVSLTSEPGALQLLYGSTALIDAVIPPILEQPLWIDPTALFLAELAIADTTGLTTFSFPIPNVPELIDEQFWLQGMGGASFPLQSSPPIGGVVR